MRFVGSCQKKCIEDENCNSFIFGSIDNVTICKSTSLKIPTDEIDHFVRTEDGFSTYVKGKIKGP